MSSMSILCGERRSGRLSRQEHRPANRSGVHQGRSRRPDRPLCQGSTLTQGQGRTLSSRLRSATTKPRPQDRLRGTACSRTRQACPRRGGVAVSAAAPPWGCRTGAVNQRDRPRPPPARQPAGLHLPGQRRPCVGCGGRGGARTASVPRTPSDGDVRQPWRQSAASPSSSSPQVDGRGAQVDDPEVGEPLRGASATELVDEDQAAVGRRRPGREPLVREPGRVPPQRGDGVPARATARRLLAFGSSVTSWSSESVVRWAGDLEPGRARMRVRPGHPRQLAAAHPGRQRDRPFARGPQRPMHAAPRPQERRGGSGPDQARSATGGSVSAFRQTEQSRSSARLSLVSHGESRPVPGAVQPGRRTARPP
jgi:hypothetical protein